MRRAFCLFLVEFILVAVGIGVDRLLPGMSAYGWFAIAFLALAVIPVLYWPEIKGWWTRRRDGKPAEQPANPQIEESGPNWTMPELVELLLSMSIDVVPAISAIEDKARLGQLAFWGRKYSAASPHENPNPLRPIATDHWDRYCLNAMRCAYADDATTCCTEPRNPHNLEHSYTESFQDLQVNKAQAMALWSLSEGEET